MAALTPEEQAELEALEKRFPYIQGIHGDSMDMAFLSGLFLAAAFLFFYYCYPLESGKDVMQLAGGIASLVGSVLLFTRSNEEDKAIKRYFELMNASRSVWVDL